MPVTGGRPDQLLTTPAEEVQLSRDGRYILYHDKKGGENVWRKHHTSAITRDIWIYDRQANSHRQVTTFDGEDRNPVLADDDRAFYYLSEESGTFNVHRMNLDGTGTQQVTPFTGPPVRFLSRAGNGTLAFGHDGQSYTMATGAQPQRVPVTIAIDAKANNERVVTVSGGVGQLAVAPTGKEVAFIFRGDVFVTSVEGTSTKRITTTPEAETGVSFRPDGKALLYSSPRGGRWAVYEARRTRESEPYFHASTLITETAVIANDQQNSGARYSPNGKEIAYLEDRTTLRVLTPATRQTRTLLTDQQLWGTGPNQQFSWSPDGKWLLFDYSVPGVAPGEVGLVRADGTGTPINLTQSGFDDGNARWIIGGKAMLWFSNRDGLKSVAQTGGTQRDVYAMFFTQEAWDRFRLSQGGLRAGEGGGGQRRQGQARQRQDGGSRRGRRSSWTALPIRKARLTIHSSSLGDALISKDGETLYYLARFERGLNLWSTNLRTRETAKMLAMNANGGSMTWDKEQKNIFLLADGGISKIDPASAKRETVSINSEMIADTAGGARGRVRPRLAQGPRHLLHPELPRRRLGGTPPVYEKYLPHIGNSYEFAEMLTEMLGELNV